MFLSCGRTLLHGPCSFPLILQVNLCPVDCKISHWSAWSDCSQSCGTGTKTRKRTILSRPLYGGLPCSPSDKDYVETYDCVVGYCKVDGLWSEWSRWSYCQTNSGTPCGKGTRHRSRDCDSPKPENGGANCLGKARPKDSKLASEKNILTFDKDTIVENAF